MSRLLKVCLLPVGAVLAHRPAASELMEAVNLNASKQFSSKGSKQCKVLYMENGSKKAIDPSLTVERFGSIDSDKCYCECTGKECFTCSEGVVHQDDNGVTTCQDTGSTVPSEVVETKTPAPCGENGELKIIHGKPVCSVPSKCPPAPASSEFTAVPVSECSCEFDLECSPKDGYDPKFVEAIMEDNNLVCKYHTPEKVIAGGNVLGKPSCKEPFEMEDGKCVHPQPCKLGTVQLSQEMLACGPQTPEYMGFMFDEMMRKQNLKDYKDAKPKTQGCYTNCISVFAKLSECYKQNDVAQCLGAENAATVKHPASKFVELDKKNHSVAGKWLTQGKKAEKMLPCRALFAASKAYNTADGKSVWEDIAKTIEEAGSERLLELQGDYSEVPPRPIACRDAFCRKIMIMQVVGTKNNLKRLSECYASCDAINGFGSIGGFGH